MSEREKFDEAYALHKEIVILQDQILVNQDADIWENDELEKKVDDLLSQMRSLVCPVPTTELEVKNQIIFLSRRIDSLEELILSNVREGQQDNYVLQLKHDYFRFLISDLLRFYSDQ